MQTHSRSPRKLDFERSVKVRQTVWFRSWCLYG